MNKSTAKEIVKKLKTEAGTHSPSRVEIVNQLGYDPIKVDMCFLSNPLATDLILSDLTNFFSTENIKNIIEPYPANQKFLLDRMSIIEELPPEVTVVTNGAQHGIEILLSSIKYKNVLLPIPTFSSYYEALKSNCNLYHFELRKGENYRISAQRLFKKISDDSIDLLILISPNNPTGQSIDPNLILELISLFPSLRIILDDSFSHFMDTLYEWKDFRSKLISLSPNVFFVKSLSKDFGVAGVRLGLLATSNPIINEIKRRFCTWCINNLAIEVLNILSKSSFLVNYEKARLSYLQIRKNFYKQLKEIDAIATYNSDANFFLIEMKDTEKDGFDIVTDLLIDNGIYIRTMSDKIGLGGTFFRVACRNEVDNNLFIQTFKNHLK